MSDSSYARYTKLFSVSEEPEMVIHLDELAKESQLSRSSLVRQLIREALAARTT